MGGSQPNRPRRLQGDIIGTKTPRSLERQTYTIQTYTIQADAPLKGATATHEARWVLRRTWPIHSRDASRLPRNVAPRAVPGISGGAGEGLGDGLATRAGHDQGGDARYVLTPHVTPSPTVCAASCHMIRWGRRGGWAALRCATRWLRSSLHHLFYH